VLFVCTHNSARSQLAEALWNRRAGGTAGSAGTHPAAQVHPLAIDVAARHGLDLAAAQTRLLSNTTPIPDLLVTVCDQANEELPPGAVTRLHWSIPDPAAVGTLAAFEQAFRLLDLRVNRLVNRLPG
jgi:protein-tyrosine-phosphatase